MCSVELQAFREYYFGDYQNEGALILVQKLFGLEKVVCFIDSNKFSFYESKRLKLIPVKTIYDRILKSYKLPNKWNNLIFYTLFVRGVAV